MIIFAPMDPNLILAEARWQQAPKETRAPSSAARLTGVAASRIEPVLQRAAATWRNVAGRLRGFEAATTFKFGLAGYPDETRLSLHPANQSAGEDFFLSALADYDGEDVLCRAIWPKGGEGEVLGRFAYEDVDVDVLEGIFGDFVRWLGHRLPAMAQN